jgi:hypothetical protein
VPIEMSAVGQMAAFRQLQITSVLPPIADNGLGALQPPGAARPCASHTYPANSLSAHFNAPAAKWRVSPCFSSNENPPGTDFPAGLGVD